MTFKPFVIIAIIFIGFFFWQFISPNNISEKEFEKPFGKLKENNFFAMTIQQGKETLRLKKDNYWQVENEFLFPADALQISTFLNQLSNSVYLRQKKENKKESLRGDVHVRLSQKNKDISFTLNGFQFQNNRPVGRYLTYENQLYLVDYNFIDIDPNERIWFQKFLPKVSEIRTVRLFRSTSIFWQLDNRQGNFSLVKPRKNISKEVKKKIISLINKFRYLVPTIPQFIDRDDLLRPYSLEFATYQGKSFIMEFLKERDGFIILKLKSLPKQNPLYNEWHFLLPKQEVQDILDINKTF